ncbi:hypothetical protein [Methanobrevibacter sp.]|uniref:hypothetical protein n=1 Tax=Methanobrevibacter sp. TaxID=66852 RepID=UPI0025DEE181|nr:hypothetical protein [Methanobrevibacter sp.]MBQ2832163.1 hypothetical protein [Methanobrevibacter sp.]
MKLKLAIIFGILIWAITYILTSIINPIFTKNLPGINIIVPIILIITTTFFGILYIRNIDSNEVIEGLTAGLIFIIVDIICDFIFFLYPNNQTLIFTDYTLHLFSVIVLTLLITTFLGYLAQMNIDLK